MDRFYVGPGEWGESPTLAGDEAHHCVRVMRKKAGDEVAVFDGKGRHGVARIVEASKSEVILEIISSSQSKPLVPDLEIAVGVPKGKSFEFVLQKAVEMGVTTVQPLMSAQGNVRFGKKEGRAKREKWERVVLEACKQCGQDFLPEVRDPLDVSEYLAQVDPGSSRFVGALLPGVRPFRDALAAGPGSGKIVVMIGPEGDFSEEEYERILGAGFTGVSLGNLILRTETAVFWMVAAVRYQFQ